MSHLTDEQLEDILQGNLEPPEHIEQCPECRGRLAEAQALARRVRQAFSSVHASGRLAERIRTDLTAREPAAGNVRPRIVPLRVRRRLWSALAAAAAILLVTMPIGFYTYTGAQAKAAQTMLTEIHQINLRSPDQPMAAETNAGVRQHLESMLGEGPVMPCAQSGGTCSCSVRQFHGRSVPSCLVKGPSALVSIIAVSRSPKALGMTPVAGRGASQRGVWQAQCRGCNMAAIRIGESTYCAIGQVSQEELAGVLTGLSP
jgi:anti-sigma factor RsiW